VTLGGRRPLTEKTPSQPTPEPLRAALAGGAAISLVKVVDHDGGMTTWFRTYYEGADLWLYFGAGDEG